MISQEDKNRILSFMPVMLELEAMGRNPVEDLFAPSFDMELVESCYVALNRAKEKYPAWDAVISKWISKRMRR